MAFLSLISAHVTWQSRGLQVVLFFLNIANQTMMHDQRPLITFPLREAPWVDDQWLVTGWWLNALALWFTNNS